VSERMFLWYHPTWVIVNEGPLDGLLYVSNNDCRNSC